MKKIIKRAYSVLPLSMLWLVAACEQPLALTDAIPGDHHSLATAMSCNYGSIASHEYRLSDELLGGSVERHGFQLSESVMPADAGAPPTYLLQRGRFKVSDHEMPGHPPSIWGKAVLDTGANVGNAASAMVRNGQWLYHSARSTGVLITPDCKEYFFKRYADHHRTLRQFTPLSASLDPQAQIADVIGWHRFRPVEHFPLREHSDSSIRVFEGMEYDGVSLKVATHLPLPTDKWHVLLKSRLQFAEDWGKIDSAYSPVNQLLSLMPLSRRTYCHHGDCVYEEWVQVALPFEVLQRNPEGFSILFTGQQSQSVTVRDFQVQQILMATVSLPPSDS